MIVVYDSMTGQVKRAAAKLGYPVCPIASYKHTDDSVVFLLTRSFGYGEVPSTTREFLKHFRDRVIGCAVSGSVNWGNNFGKAGVTIELEYGITCVTKFEASGFEHEISLIKRWIENYLLTHETLSN